MQGLFEPRHFVPKGVTAAAELADHGGVSVMAIVVAGAVGISGMLAAPEVPLQRPSPQSPTPQAAPTVAPAPAPSSPVEPTAPETAASLVEPVATPPATPAEAEPAATVDLSAQTEAELAADQATFDGSTTALDTDGVEWLSNEAEADRNRKLTAARTMVAAGALAGVGSVLMIIAAGVEGAKPACDFGLDDCPDAPRKGLTAGLGVTGGLFAAGGAALMTVGAIRLRRLKATVRASEESAFVSFGGCF